MAEERLQKIIARAGVVSRRAAEQLIREGRVTVNGKAVSELGTKADPQRDHIKVDGKLLPRPETHRYILLNKPRGVVSTLSDPEGRPTVIDLLVGVRERVYPVGRLDFNSEGLLLLTNDGDLANRLTHPRHGIQKVYHAKVRGVPEEDVLEKLRRGVVIDGRRTAPAEIARLRTTGRGEAGNSWIEVRIREGRNQQIRKMFLLAGHAVQKLKRVAIGALEDDRLEAGSWRDLDEREIRALERPERERPTRARSDKRRKTTRKGGRR